jgi:hypothetical protein|tara:strand:+ start:245 stop:553 length:309 start_codon:yes stop_codon:yes gene_type:complete
MIVTINNDKGETLFDIAKVKDEEQQAEAKIIVQKTGTLGVIIEALDFANRTHRANLGKLLEACPEAVFEPERARDEDGKFIADDPSTPDTNEAWKGGKKPTK